MSAPPNYSPEDQLASTSFSTTTTDPQLTITPVADALHFQQGHLGIDGERPAIEGEIQIKGAHGRVWDSLTITLDSTESTATEAIQIDTRTFTLFKKDTLPDHPQELPSSITFSIPLNPDTPQCIHTPHLDITHRLTAVLHPASSHDTPLRNSVVAHTRRFSPRSSLPAPYPEVLQITDPVAVEIQLPRRSFLSGEIIPIYISIPPVTREHSELCGLALRSVSCQLRRVVSASISRFPEALYESLEVEGDGDIGSYSNDLVPVPEKTSQEEDNSRDDEDDDNWRTVVAKSGALCRFNDSRTIKMRLLLRLPDGELGPGPVSSTTIDTHNSDSPDCGLITQSSLLGTVEFKLVASISFINSAESRERVVSVSIPVTILPSPAPASEIDPSLDAAYRKKHDQPPDKTVRHPQAETSVIQDVLEAGPSVHAPPPFEDADVPPPFPSAVSQNHTHPASHPPTFVESQADLTDMQVLSEQLQNCGQQSPVHFVPEGEGVLFGFRSSEQFDGIQTSNASSSPQFPIGTDGSIHSGTQTLDRHVHLSGATEGLSNGVALPLGMDDLSDPPPAIDVAYIVAPGHTADAMRLEPPPPHSDEDPHPIRTSSPPVSRDSVSAAPPPYLSPQTSSGNRSVVSRPPPYVERNNIIEH